LGNLGKGSYCAPGGFHLENGRLKEKVAMRRKHNNEEETALTFFQV
jgi:hypothetical protein